LEVQRLSSLSGREAYVDLDSRNLDKTVRDKLAAARLCLKEIDLWRGILHLSAPALTELQIVEMFRSGRVPVEALLGKHDATERARLLYFGRLYFLASNEELRLREETVYLKKEVARLHWSLVDKLRKIDSQIPAARVWGGLPDVWELTGGSFYSVVQSFQTWRPPLVQEQQAPAFFSFGRLFQLQQKQCLLKQLLAEVEQFAPGGVLPDAHQPPAV
jgi:hypothetical protein